MTSMFKMKPDKKRYYSETTTLDESHKNTIISFTKKKQLLPEMNRKLKNLEQKLDQLEKRDKSSYTTQDVKTRSELKSKISLLRENITEVNNNILELDYYDKTNDVLMDYYNITGLEEIENAKDDVIVDTEEENLEDVEEEENKENKEEENINKENINKENLNKKTQEKLSILERLNLKNKNKKVKATKVPRNRKYATQDSINSLNKTNNISKYFNIETKDEEKDGIITVKNKTEIFDQYNSLTNHLGKKKPNLDRMTKCKHCNRDKNLVLTDGIYVCECGAFDKLTFEMDGIEGGEGGRIGGVNSYRKIAHATE
jgi:myosin heavy subunit